VAFWGATESSALTVRGRRKGRAEVREQCSTGDSCAVLGGRCQEGVVLDKEAREREEIHASGREKSSVTIKGVKYLGGRLSGIVVITTVQHMRKEPRGVRTSFRGEELFQSLSSEEKEISFSARGTRKSRSMTVRKNEFLELLIAGSSARKRRRNGE